MAPLVFNNNQHFFLLHLIIANIYFLLIFLLSLCFRSVFVTLFYFNINFPHKHTQALIILHFCMLAVDTINFTLDFPSTITIMPILFCCDRMFQSWILPDFQESKIPQIWWIVKKRVKSVLAQALKRHCENVGIFVIQMAFSEIPK